MFDLNQKIKLSDTVSYKEVDGEIVLLDMKSESFYGLDAVASDIWRLLQKGKTLQETYDALLAIYEVAPEKLLEDLEKFIGRLTESGLIELVKS